METLSDKIINKKYGGTIMYTEDIKDFIKKVKEEDKLRTGICIIISYMLDNPDKHGIYPTTKCFNELIDFFKNRVNNEAGPKLT